jgi:hypothetical protein
VNSVAKRFTYEKIFRSCSKLIRTDIMEPAAFLMYPELGPVFSKCLDKPSVSKKWVGPGVRYSSIGDWLPPA